VTSRQGIDHNDAAIREKDRVTVRTRAGNSHGARFAAGSADVLDDDRAEQRFHSVCPWTANGIDHPARWIRNDEAYRSRRIGLSCHTGHAHRCSEHHGNKPLFHALLTCACRIFNMIGLTRQ
jgi:hypothetical protein